MRLRYNFRVYPAPGQREALARAFGCARVVFNDGLRARQEARSAGLPYIKDTDLQKQVITAAKKTPERVWLAEVSSVVLVQALADLHTAYRNFFASAAGRRKGRRVAPPRYRSRIDLGLTHFAVLPDGRKITSPRFLRRVERRLRKAQRALSRKARGSANRIKARARVARLHARVADTRRDHHHKLSTRLIRENQAVYVEDLAVNGLARTRLAKSVHDAGWSQFVAMLEYNAARYGRAFARIGRFEPTSQVCSACGVKDGPKPLHVREWTCTACGTVHDRDVNAARNILAAGRADRVNACGGTVRPPV
ncbi:putative transposase [Actinomadura rubteroloni]|uniref:Putative transposase n=1 Tax=Actinomadura rubteroloni TaxID=1926885 RepID=A0A2P4ULI7_9ACTN|nr:RNA-guided endonuclease TnpB family protein [Actinomadura rubteroloni]POM25916.1 putative transposase [Actinomadura rubteroloni]